jgi:uncharacterized protein YaaW (UPF0174 family)
LGKGTRLKRLRRSKEDIEKRFSELLTKNFQKELRNSEMWDQMVAEFGEEKAEKLLREIKAEGRFGDDI